MGSVSAGPRARNAESPTQALEAAGYEVLRQPQAVGLTDLWNRAVRLGLERGYASILLANNDVLVPDGAIGLLRAALEAEPRRDLKSPKPMIVVYEVLQS